MLDRFGLLPEDIRAKYEREEMIDRSLAAGQALSRAVKAFDERCDVVFISDRVRPGEVPAMGEIIPGRWHVRRRNDGAADSYIPVTTEDGGYRDPDWGILRELQERDMWSHHYVRPSALEDEAKRIVEGEREREAMREELAHDFRAISRMGGDGGMTRRLRGKK